MQTDIGEYIVGAYLAIIADCPFVQYNVRAPGGGLDGLNELDVVGLNVDTGTAYLCEVATHLDGLNYGTGNAATIARIAKKHEWQRGYATEHLVAFPQRHYMLWSPVVPIGALTAGLGTLADLELVINGDYTARIAALRARAWQNTADHNNPFFRTLQILEHLKESPPSRSHPPHPRLTTHDSRLPSSGRWNCACT